MDHRIRAAALVFDEGRLLLVKEYDPDSKEEWWVPPGGGLQPPEDIFSCAARETAEETGLTVELGRIVYISEFQVTGESKHHLELFLLAKRIAGELSIANAHPDDYISAVRFFSKEEASDIVLKPVMLAEAIWSDLSKGFPTMRYLGYHDGYPPDGEGRGRRPSQ